MREKLCTGVIMSLLVLSLLLPNSLNAAPEDQGIYPFPWYNEVPVNGVLWPRLASPAFVCWGDEFDIYIAKIVELPPDAKWDIRLTSIYAHVDPKLEVISQEYNEFGQVEVIGSWKISVKVPKQIPPGLYNLTARADGKEFVEPNAVYVFGESYPEELTILHWTDSHFGSRENFPKHLENTRLLKIFVSTINALNPDIAIHTGDLVDAIAKLEEENFFSNCYRELVKLRVPIIAVEGNNDDVANQKGGFFWEKYFGPLYTYVKVGNYAFALLDTDTGKVIYEQIPFIKAVSSETYLTVALQHYPLEDRDLRMWVNESGKLKILDYDETINKLMEFYNDLNVKLVLVGHGHSDEEWDYDGIKVVETGGAQFDRGESEHDPNAVYGRFRIIKLRPDGFEVGKTLTLAHTNVTFFQENDGSSSGVSFLVANGLDYALNTKVLVLLNSYTDSPTVEGATLVHKEELPDGRGLYALNVSVAPGESKVVKIYTQPDAEPPVAEIKSFKYKDKIGFHVVARDSGLGVLSYKVFVSTDNKSWSELAPKYENGYPMFYVDSSTGYYVKVEVKDVAANVGTSYADLTPAEVQTPTPTPTPAAPRRNMLPVLVAAVIGVIIVVAAVFMRRTR